MFTGIVTKPNTNPSRTTNRVGPFRVINTSFGGVSVIRFYQTPLAGTANIGIVLEPKGTGAFSLTMPDGTASVGGNARGAGAVDLQLLKSAATQVASGAGSFVVGVYSTASGDYSGSIGYNNTVAGFAAVAVGSQHTLSGTGYTFAAGGGHALSGQAASALGGSAVISAPFSTALGFASNISGGGYSTACGSTHTITSQYSFAGGVYASATHYGEFAYSSGRFTTNGDSQRSFLEAFKQTTDATPTELKLDNSIARATLVAGTTWNCIVNIIGRTTGAGAKSASFLRRVHIDRMTNAASTAIVGSVQTIGTDTGTNAGSPPAGWAVAITADTTNAALLITVTGEAATTIIWNATIDIAQLILA